MDALITHTRAADVDPDFIKAADAWPTWAWNLPRASYVLSRVPLSDSQIIPLKERKPQRFNKDAQLSQRAYCDVMGPWL